MSWLVGLPAWTMEAEASPEARATAATAPSCTNSLRVRLSAMGGILSGAADRLVSRKHGSGRSETRKAPRRTGDDCARRRAGMTELDAPAISAPELLYLLIGPENGPRVQTLAAQYPRVCRTNPLLIFRLSLQGPGWLETRLRGPARSPRRRRNGHREGPCRWPGSPCIPLPSLRTTCRRASDRGDGGRQSAVHGRE